MFKLSSLLVVTLFTFSFLAQEPGDFCSEAGPLCADAPVTFPAGVNSGSAESGPDYGCLGSQPNPGWYYIQIDIEGDIEFTLTPSPLNDIDFALWGPFPDLSSSCNNLTANCGGLFNPCINFPSGNLIDCSFDPQSIETAYIPNAQIGEYYILLITNFSNNTTDISIEQTGGTGGTDCSEVIPCALELDAGEDGRVCINEFYDFSASFSNAEGSVTFEWTAVPEEALDDLDDPTSLTPTFNPSQFYGDVVFTLTGVDDGPNEGPCEVSSSVTITVIDLPLLTTEPICPGSDAVFFISGEPNTLIEYTIDEGASSNSVTLNAQGQAEVTIENPSLDQAFKITTVTVDDCEMETDSLFVLVEQSDLSIDALSQTSSACGLTSGEVQASVSGFSTDVSFLWSGPGAESEISVNDTIWQGLASGWYYFVVEDGSCVLTDSIFVEEQDGPTASFTATPQGGNAPIEITFENNSLGGTEFIWDFGNGEGVTVQNQSSQNVLYTEEGDYEVELIVNQDGCSDTVVLIVPITDFAPLIYTLPNVFTPNGDGVNDVFTINLENAVSATMVIVNRWGNVVFETDSVDPKWNGRVNNDGNDCVEGTYFYQFTAVGEDGEEVQEHGSVQLVRDNDKN